MAAWIVFSAWNTHMAVMAAPLPQSAAGGSSYPANDSSLNDPFSTPDYLAPSKFTWQNCIYGLLFIFFGGVEVLHGYKYIRFTMLVAGFLVWASVAVMIMIIADTNSGIYQTSAVYFAVWFIVGLIGGAVSFYFWHIGIILTGAYGMFVLVAIIFTATNVQSYVLRFTFLAIFLVLGGILTKKYERMSVILSTSFGGAYSIIFGLDMFVQAGFRATFHVILSMSTARFHPVTGTWIMIACVPVIAVFGIIWELKHHEEPVASWWFGQGARPGDDKENRRCCGLVAAKPPTKVITPPTSPALPGTISPPKDPKAKRRCCGGGSKANKPSIPSTPSTPSKPVESTSVVVCCIPCCGKRKTTTTTKTTTTAATATATSTKATEKTKKVTVVEAARPGGSNGAGPSAGAKLPQPVEKAHIGHETIGHTGVHKVVIHKEVRELSMDYYEDY
ncbi:hypothetical protein BGZ52_006406 [Haplosporangium bisporale]|nr:hypothetical protein BGZ52_006406 [Haplosporangium bisporale]